MTLIRSQPELERPIEGVEDLVAFLRSGEKPRERYRVGTEHEKLGMYADTLEPVPYEGPRGIGALLGVLERDHGYTGHREDGKLIALERDGATITLEPGGQLELSGAPLETLHETCREFRQHVALMKHVSQPFGIVWLGLGIHPTVSLGKVPRMPRERHAIMHEYMARRDELGLVMMHLTGTVQANFDFESEADLARKLRVALAASPVVTALYANSSVSDGGPNGFESRRAWVWRHTDPDRCGFLPFVFADGWGEGEAYRRYVEWALDVPVFFVERAGRCRPVGGRPFRELLRHGYEGAPATLADWNVHLTTLFPEVRLKRIIEVRGADAVPPDLVCGLPALWKGLLYDPSALADAESRLRHWTHAQVDALHAEVARIGLEAQTPDGPVAAVARELVDLSARGLAWLDRRSGTGETEAIFLEPLYAILDRGTSPGRHLLDRWESQFSRRADLLVEYARY